MQIELYDTVHLGWEDGTQITTRTRDREGNVMFALEDEDGFLLEDLFYPSQLIKVQENN